MGEGCVGAGSVGVGCVGVGCVEVGCVGAGCVGALPSSCEFIQNKYVQHICDDQIDVQV